MIYYTKGNKVYTHYVEGANKTEFKDVDDIDCRMVTLTGNRLIVNKCRGDVIYGYRCVGIEPLQFLFNGESFNIDIAIYVIKKYLSMHKIKRYDNTWEVIRNDALYPWKQTTL